MELQKIKTKTTWQEAVDSLNANSQAIQIEFDKVGEKNRGYYVSLASLNVAHPTGNVGDIAYVGTVAPFNIYTWDGSSWIDTGETGGSDDLDLSGFFPNTGGTITDDVEIQGDLSVVGEMEVGSFFVKGKTSDDILLGDGTTLSVDEVGSLKAIETSDINEYEDIWQ